MLNISLDTLTVVRKSDRVGRDEPMIWTMFIEVSADTLNSHQFVIKTDPLAGKLEKAGEGDTVAIPTKAGRYATRKDQLFHISAVAIAFDNDLRTKGQIRDAYNAAAAALNQGILDQLINILDEETREQAFAVIETQVSDAIRKAFFERRPLLTLVGGQPIGGDTFRRGLLIDMIDQPFELELTRDAKDPKLPLYKVQGRLKFRKSVVSLP